MSISQMRLSSQLILLGIAEILFGLALLVFGIAAGVWTFR